VSELEVWDADDLVTLEEGLRKGQVHAIQHRADPLPLLALLDRLRPPELRELAIGWCNPRHEPGSGEDELGDLSGLWVHRQLEKLDIQGKVAAFGVIDAPRLRKFEWVTIMPEAWTLASVAEARWPELESLVLWLGIGADDNIPAEVEAMHTILDGRGLPRVRHLGLCGGTLTEGVLKRLPGCGILPQLRTLDLSGSYRTDRERQALARLRKHPAFQHLEQMEI